MIIMSHLSNKRPSYDIWIIINNIMIKPQANTDHLHHQKSPPSAQYLRQSFWASWVSHHSTEIEWRNMINNKKQSLWCLEITKVLVIIKNGRTKIKSWPFFLDLSSCSHGLTQDHRHQEQCFLPISWKWVTKYEVLSQCQAIQKCEIALKGRKI
jgi:hypothetical protein